MEKLTDSIRIHGLLKRLMDQGSMVAITIEGNGNDFNTSIIDVSMEDQTFILDELKPENGHTLLKQSPQFTLDAQLEGIRLSFKASVAEFGIKDNIAYYKVKTPDSIDYHQLREAVRVHLSAANPLPVTLTTEKAHVIKGEIADLSLGGLRIRFNNELPDTLENGQELKCSFPLPPDNKETFECEIVIRAIRHENRPHQKAFLGVQFLKLASSQERQIQRSIMVLQRAKQQKRSI